MAHPSSLPPHIVAPLSPPWAEVTNKIDLSWLLCVQKLLELDCFEFFFKYVFQCPRLCSSSHIHLYASYAVQCAMQNSCSLNQHLKSIYSETCWENSVRGRDESTLIQPTTLLYTALVRYTPPKGNSSLCSFVKCSFIVEIFKRSKKMPKQLKQ